MYRILIVIVLLTSTLLSEEWQIDKKGENKVIFHSSTTLLDFEGVTDKVDGYLYWKDDSLLFPGNNTVYFEVQPASFETGIGKRDSDMRSDVLETDKFPIAAFKGEIIQFEKRAAKTNVVAEGEMTLHGVVKHLRIEATLIKKQDRISIESNFSIFLKDYNIDAPSLMAFVKVAQEIKINVSLNMKKIK